MEKIIELQDGILVKVQTQEEARYVSGGSERVDSSINIIQSNLSKISEALQSAWRTMSKNGEVIQAEIDFGMGFEAKGNLCLVSSKADMHFNIKMVMRKI